MSCDYEPLIDQSNLIESSIFGCKSIFRTRSLKNWFTFKLKNHDNLLYQHGVKSNIRIDKNQHFHLNQKSQNC